MKRLTFSLALTPMLFLAAAANAQLPRGVEAIQARSDKFLADADDRWRKLAVATKQRELNELQKLRDGAEKVNRGEVEALDALMQQVEQQLATLKAAAPSKLALSAVVKPAVEMYDVMKNPNEGDRGIAFRESKLRPRDHSAAYQMLTKGMTKDEVLAILGGYQEDRDRDNELTLTWMFNFGFVGQTRVTVILRDGKVISFSRSRTN